MRPLELFVHGYPSGGTKRGMRSPKVEQLIMHHLLSNLKDDGETETGYEKVGAISLHTDSDKLGQMEERAIEKT